MAVLVCGVVWASASLGDDGSAAKPAVQEARGIDWGGDRPMVFVARDKAAWEKVMQSEVKRQVVPSGMEKGGDPTSLGKVDFGKQMIVAVFWGEMSFAGQGEKCWIDRVTLGKDEVVVDCRATLWGGGVKHAYRAWPYHAKVVERSDLPVRFRQTTELKADPTRGEKEKTIGVLQPADWKREVKVEK